jgi:hypothetical protein
MSLIWNSIRLLWNMLQFSGFRCCQRGISIMVDGSANVKLAKSRWNREHDDIYLCYFKTLWPEIRHVSLETALCMTTCRLCLSKRSFILSKSELDPYLSLYSIRRVPDPSRLNPCVQFYTIYQIQSLYNYDKLSKSLQDIIDVFKRKNMGETIMKIKYSAKMY